MPLNRHWNILGIKQMPNSIKKYKLDFKDGFLNETAAFGIVTAESEIQISLEIQKLTGVALSFDRGLEIKQRQKMLAFNLFSYMDEETGMNYLLIKNKVPSGFFTKEYAQVDYIVVLHGEKHKQECRLLPEKIKTSTRVQTTMELDVSKIKNLKNILL